MRAICMNRYEYEPTCHNQPCGKLGVVGVPVILVLASEFRPPKKRFCVGEKKRGGEDVGDSGNEGG